MRNRVSRKIRFFGNKSRISQNNMSEAIIGKWHPQQEIWLNDLSKTNIARFTSITLRYFGNERFFYYQFIYIIGSDKITSKPGIALFHIIACFAALCLNYDAIVMVRVTYTGGLCLCLRLFRVRHVGYFSYYYLKFDEDGQRWKKWYGRMWTWDLVGIWRQTGSKECTSIFVGTD